MQWKFRLRLCATSVVTALAAATADTARADMMSACQSDIANFCSGVPGGRGRITACLFSQSSKLEMGCRSEVAAVVKQLRSDRLLPIQFRNLIGVGGPLAVPAACSADEGELCSSADPGGQSVMACLYAHSGHVSAGCSSEIEASLK